MKKEVKKDIHRILLTLHNDEYQKIASEAKSKGLPLATYVKLLVRGEIKWD